MKQPEVLTLLPNGDVCWEPETGDEYLLIGKTRDGKKFRLHFDNYLAANCINMWNGRKYLIRNGKKYLICTVLN